VYYTSFIIVNYVSEHLLPHAVNTFHITPTTHINWGLILLKLIGGDIIFVLSGSRTYWDHVPDS